MLVIDDSSTDNSADIVNGYAAKDKRIRYFRTERPSGSPALPRNIGIDNASGDYVAFLDSDDVWLSDKLEKQMSFIAGNGHRLVYSFYEKMDWEGNRNNRVIRTAATSTYSSLLNSNAIPMLTSVVCRKAIDTTRFRQIPQEDFCFWLDVLKKGVTAHNLCEVTALYRETRASRSANKLDMFKGYWRVIRDQQHIPFFLSCCHMVRYTITGFAKYLK